jgi:hypothetical protein
MSFTSHIFTSLPLVHTLNPDFLRRHLWLCFLLVRESPRSGNLHVPWLPNSSSIILPNFTDSRFHDFAGSWLRVFTSSRLRGFAGSWLRVFTSSRLRGFAGFWDFRIIACSRLQGFARSWLRVIARSRLQGSARSWLRVIARSRRQGFACSWLRVFTGSWFRGFADSRLWITANSLFLKTHFTNFMNQDVSRVTGFPEFPNTSPSGKRVDSDDPIPRKSQNFSKKRHPRNVRGNTRHPETSQRLNRGAFAELPPGPYE